MISLISTLVSIMDMQDSSKPRFGRRALDSSPRLASFGKSALSSFEPVGSSNGSAGVPPKYGRRGGEGRRPSGSTPAGIPMRPFVETSSPMDAVESLLRETEFLADPTRITPRAEKSVLKSDSFEARVLQSQSRSTPRQHSGPNQVRSSSPLAGSHMSSPSDEGSPYHSPYAGRSTPINTGAYQPYQKNSSSSQNLAQDDEAQFGLGIGISSASLGRSSQNMGGSFRKTSGPAPTSTKPAAEAEPMEFGINITPFRASDPNPQYVAAAAKDEKPQQSPIGASSYRAPSDNQAPPLPTKVAQRAQETSPSQPPKSTPKSIPLGPRVPSADLIKSSSFIDILIEAGKASFPSFEGNDIFPVSVVQAAGFILASPMEELLTLIVKFIKKQSKQSKTIPDELTAMRANPAVVWMVRGLRHCLDARYYFMSEYISRRFRNLARSGDTYTSGMLQQDILIASRSFDSAVARASGRSASWPDCSGAPTPGKAVTFKLTGILWDILLINGGATSINAPYAPACPPFASPYCLRRGCLCPHLNHLLRLVISSSIVPSFNPFEGENSGGSRFSVVDDVLSAGSNEPGVAPSLAAVDNVLKSLDLADLWASAPSQLPNVNRDPWNELSNKRPLKLLLDGTTLGQMVHSSFLQRLGSQCIDRLKLTVNRSQVMEDFASQLASAGFLQAPEASVPAKGDVKVLQPGFHRTFATEAETAFVEEGEGHGPRKELFAALAEAVTKPYGSIRPCPCLLSGKEGQSRLFGSKVASWATPGSRVWLPSGKVVAVKAGEGEDTVVVDSVLQQSFQDAALQFEPAYSPLLRRIEATGSYWMDDRAKAASANSPVSFDVRCRAFGWAVGAALVNKAILPIELPGPFFSMLLAPVLPSQSPPASSRASLEDESRRSSLGPQGIVYHARAFELLEIEPSYLETLERTLQLKKKDFKGVLQLEGLPETCKPDEYVSYVCVSRLRSSSARQWGVT